MSTLKARVEDYTGTVSDTDALNQWLSEGARVVIHALPERLLWNMSTETTVPAGGLAIAVGKILGVHKSGNVSREVPVTMKSRITDDGSIYRATDNSPMHYLDQGKVYVWGATEGGSVQYAAYPSVDSSLSAISGFHTDLDHLPVLYAAAKVQFAKGTSEAIPTQGAAATAPTPPALGTTTYTTPGYDHPIITVIPAPPLDLTLTLPTLVESFTAPTVSLPVVPTIPAPNFSSVTVPTLPTAPAISYVGATAGTISATTISALPTVPTYSSPAFGGSLTLTLPADIDLSTKLDGLTALSVPTPPAAPTIVHVDATATTAAAPTATNVSTPTFTKPTFTTLVVDTPSLPTLDLTKKIDGVTALVAPVAPSDPTLSSTGLGGSLTISLPTAPTYTKPVVTIDRTDWDAYLAEEDPEMMLRTHEEILSQLQEQQVQIGDELNEFNKELEAQRSELQKNIAQAQITLEERRATMEAADAMVLQDYIQELSLYDRELALYQNDVNVVVQKYRLAYDAAVQTWAQEAQLKFEKYSLELQAEVQKYQGDLAKYNADVQIELADQNAALSVALDNARRADELNQANKAADLQALVEDWRADVEKFNTDMAAFNANVEVQLQEFNTNLQKALQDYIQEQTRHLEKYQLDIAIASAEFTGNMQDHMAEVERLIAQAQLDQQRLVTSAQLATETSLQNELQTKAALVEDYQLELQRHRQDLESYSLQTQHIINEYQADELGRQITLWTEEANQKLQQYQLDIQKEAARLGGELDIFRASLESVLQEFNLKSSRNLDMYRAETEAHIAAFRANLDASQVDVEAELNIARLDIEDVATANQVLIAKFQNEVVSYQVSAGEGVQRYSQLLERFMASRQGYLADAQALMAEFDKSLQIYLAGNQ